MEQNPSSSSSIRFLSFANDKEDAEKKAKLEEAASRIEQAIAREKSLSELVDYKPSIEESIDLANDTRSLYDRLQEQKNKKKEAIEESQKLSNLVSTLDEDDVSYLNEVARNKQEEELKKRLEVYDALEEQKRLNEKKILDHEKKIKESLIFTKTNSNKISSLKLKISSIKMKPKQTKPSETRSETEPEPESDHTQRESSNSDKALRASEKRSHPSFGTHNRNEFGFTETINHGKRHKHDQHPDEKDPLEKDKLVNVQTSAGHQDRRDVMRCIGTLPSLPIVKQFPNSSDSDNSDDDVLGPRLVPRVGGRKK